MITLTANNYRSNIKWSLRAENKIDTVNMSPISNTMPDTDIVFSTTDATQAEVNGKQVSLPIADATPPTHWRWVRNNYWMPFESTDYAKARMQCVMASGKQTITIDDAITGTPDVRIELVGNSYSINRGESTFDKYPTVADLQNENFNLAKWVRDNHTTSMQGLNGIYKDNTVWMNPWVRKVIPVSYPLPWETDKFNALFPTQADIVTYWALPASYITTTRAGKDYWSEYSNFGEDSTEKFQMFSIVTFPVDAETKFDDDALKMRNLSINFSYNIEKKSDHTFEVTWQAPVQLVYVAASQNRNRLGGKGTVDNYAYFDEITAIRINLIDRPLSSDKLELSYGLNSGKLTNVTANRNPIKLEDSEVLTIGSTYEDKSWTETLAKELLTKYKNGKYIVECEVYGSWALKNNIEVHTQMYVCTKDGTLIRRDNNICVFEVKNIEKKFTQNAFVYTLKLMEV